MQPVSNSMVTMAEVKKAGIKMIHMFSINEKKAVFHCCGNLRILQKDLRFSPA